MAAKEDPSDGASDPVADAAEPVADSGIDVVDPVVNAADSVTDVAEADIVEPVADSMSEVALYRVKSPLLHNQESFAIDSEVELTELEAAPLLAVRAVELKPMTTGVENG